MKITGVMKLKALSKTLYKYNTVTSKISRDCVLNIKEKYDTSIIPDLKYPQLDFWLSGFFQFGYFIFTLSMLGLELSFNYMEIAL